MTPTGEEDFDVVIVGAGISGLNAAYRLQTSMPHLRFAILEARDCIGGTWSFWQFPGVRSDSAMSLFGFSWYPWPHTTNMAAAGQIKTYLDEAAASRGIDKLIRFRHRVTASRWRSDEARWTIDVDVSRADGSTEAKTVRAWWLLSCSGYYDYDRPLPAVIPGIARFGGEVVHPQFWHDAVHHAGKRVVVIGSGATAVTLVPALVKTAASVTMLQRSPSYVLSLSGRDRAHDLFQRFLPARWALALNWWLNMVTETLFVYVVTRFPRFGRRLVRALMKQQLPPDVDMDKHFNPTYNPFEQRLCFCPDGNFFEALRKSTCQVVTDHIDTVTETGIRLRSGQFLEADMIVTATGLFMRLMGGVPIYVDDEPVADSVGKRFTWQGCMLEGVPNAGMILGYTAGTWTPGADVRTRMMLKVIRHMCETGSTAATPVLPDAQRARLPRRPALTNSSTYIVDALPRLPLNADVGPWRNGRTWIVDWWHLMVGDVTAGMKFSTAKA